MTKESCQDCKGNGCHFCDYCIAMGKAYIEKNFGTCPKCNGTDVYKCEACNGIGQEEIMREANDEQD